MIQRMTRAEKLSALAIRTPAIPSLGMPAYNWWEEATHGVGSGSHQTTNVPFPITTAMSFNRCLWKATGALIGTEARALMNLGKAGSDFWAPVVNLARDGRWGRNIESESPTAIIALLPLFPIAERLLIIAAVRSPGRGPLRQRRV